MRLLITGAAGMLGQDVELAASEGGHEALALPRGELDVTDRAAVERAMRDAGAQAAVNCAGWTDVDGAEAAPEEALEVNGAGAGNVARAAAAAGAWVVHVSSDYVFDGAARRPYVESDRPAPISAYGRSKLAGEREVAVQAAAAHTIVRSSWLFGLGGPCFPATVLRLAGEREELSVVDDQVGCPTFTGHLSRALVWVAEQRPVGVLHVAGAGSCSWFEFAREVVAAAGIRCEVKPTSTAERARRAPRPAYSVLGSERRPEAPELPHWRDGLREFMSAAPSSAAGGRGR